jgi:ribosomal protein S18 acetylase RimI-like enzyme
VTSWQIRRGGVKDLDAVLALWALSDLSLRESDSVELLSRLLTFDPDAVLIADSGTAVLGSLIAAWNGWRGGFYRLAVAPEHRRRGLATALVREGESRLSQRGAVRVDATVPTDDPIARGFWIAAGYQCESNRSRLVRHLSESL